MENGSTNPVFDSLAKLASPQSAPNENVVEENVTPVQENTEVQSTTEESQVVENHVENNSVKEEDYSNESEATALEDIKDVNASDDQGSGNAEEVAASESISESNWWEDDSQDLFGTTTEMEATADYSTIGKALGVEDVNAASILSKVNELNSRTKEYEEKIKSLEDNSNHATPELAQANEIARNGGDYSAYLGLSQNNWDAIPDDTLIMEGKLRGAFGSDEEGMLNYLNEMDPVQKQVMASEIRQGLKDNDEFQKAEIVRKAQERRKEVDSGIRKALDSTNELFGLKMTPSIKKNVYSSLTSGDFLKDIFQDASGKPDPVKMVKAAVVFKNLNKIVQVAMNSSANKATEKILDEVSNPSVRRAGEMVNPTVKKPKSLIEARMEHLSKGGR